MKLAVQPFDYLISSRGHFRSERAMFEYLLKTFGSKPKSSELALFLDGNIHRQNTIEAAQYNALVVGFNGIMSPLCFVLRARADTVISRTVH
jgi:hypothetical protein